LIGGSVVTSCVFGFFLDRTTAYAKCLSPSLRCRGQRFVTYTTARMSHYPVVWLPPLLLLKVLREQIHRQLARPRGACDQRPRIRLLGPVLGLSSSALSLGLVVTLSAGALGLLLLWLAIPKYDEAGIFLRRRCLLRRFAAGRVRILRHCGSSSMSL
jgi:hypothetical protein